MSNFHSLFAAFRWLQMSHRRQQDQGGSTAAANASASARTSGASSSGPSSPRLRRANLLSRGPSLELPLYSWTASLLAAKAVRRGGMAAIVCRGATPARPACSGGDSVTLCWQVATLQWYGITIEALTKIMCAAFWRFGSAIAGLGENGRDGSYDGNFTASLRANRRRAISNCHSLRP